MLAAVKGKGTTTITNAAREPEIVDLERFLNAMGARVSGAGGNVIKIEGVEHLHGAEFTIMPDRIVAATYLAASAITGGEMHLKSVEPRDMTAMLKALESMGVELKISDSEIVQRINGPLKNIPIMRTMPYPGFPTDIQSPFMAMCTLAKGTSVFIETIFENRFQHVDELVRMGADIKVDGRKLQGANVVAR
jgi:UDP-N-acetylglucosamine 1-carboxyvinyltransferase